MTNIAWFHLYETPNWNSWRHKVDEWWPSDWGQESWRVIAVQLVSIWSDEKILEMDSGDKLHNTVN